MHVVIFEVNIANGKQEEYLSIATKLRKQLISMPGFISIERFQSLVNSDKMLSLSYWEDEKSLLNWKKQNDHLIAQKKGRESIFNDYKISIANVERNYTMGTSELNYH